MIRSVKLPRELFVETVQNIEDDRYHNECLYKDETVDFIIENQKFEDCKFENISFTSDVIDNLFQNVIFDHCDFSNLYMHLNVFRTCQFVKCRFMGSDLVDSTFQDVTIQNSQCTYINANATKWKSCAFKNTIMKNGSFSEIKHTNLEIDHCQLEESEWFHTSLAGLNVSTSQIEGMKVSQDDIAGVIVNDTQAIQFAKLLGIIVL